MMWFEIFVSEHLLYIVPLFHQVGIVMYFECLDYFEMHFLFDLQLHSFILKTCIVTPYISFCVNMTV
jgi:hypothetical protein